MKISKVKATKPLNFNKELISIIYATLNVLCSEATGHRKTESYGQNSEIHIIDKNSQSQKNHYLYAKTSY